MVNKIKMLVAFLLVVAGVAGFYLLADKPLVLRILAVLAGLGVAVAVLWTTPVGQRSLGFVGESVVEARKVVWPTRKETIQTTMVAVSYTHLWVGWMRVFRLRQLLSLLLLNITPLKTLTFGTFSVPWPY